MFITAAAQEAVDDQGDRLLGQHRRLELAPSSGERAPSAPEIRLGADDHWRDATEVLGSLDRVFDQDEFNLEAVQKGLRSSWRGVVTLSGYQELKVRHFDRLYEQWAIEPGE